MVTRRHVARTARGPLIGVCLASLLAVLTYAEERDMPTEAERPDDENARSNIYPPLPEGITSFGAAVVEDRLYVYGGHRGRAHEYSVEDQSDAFRSLDLAGPDKWNDLPAGPRVQGLGMVAHGGRVYRVGGFTALNHRGEPQELKSRADFARFDPQTKKWEDLLPLPEPRSSHDAALLGDTLYVAGGWNLREPGETVWHETAWAIDLDEKPLRWRELPKSPFRRRALSMAGWNGRMYVIGGMQQQGGPTTAVAVFDPEAGRWSEGPALPGEGMEGFGTAACTADGRLYVSTYGGKLQRLSKDGRRWEKIDTLANPRFFHRMLPLDDHRLLVLGGASMTAGRFRDLEVIEFER